MDGQHACDGREFQGITADALRARVRTLIEDTWQRVSTLEFRGFSDCSSDASNAVMKVTFMTRGSAPEPLTETVTGAGLHAAYPTDVHLDWEAVRDGAPDDLRNALREFGHALGLPYEWLSRTEQGAFVPCDGVAADPAVPLVAVPAGLRDSASIMNRCGPKGMSAVLSPLDIAAIQNPTIYGRKSAGFLVGFRGRCVDIRDRVPAYLTPIVASSCDYGDRYYWTLSRAPDQPQFFTFVGANAADARCMDAYGATPGDGSAVPVLSNQYLSVRSQATSFEHVEWKLAGFCVAATDETVPRLQLQSCDGSAAQQWDFWAHDARVDWTAIRAASGACVTVRSQEDGGVSELTLQPCVQGAANQYWAPGDGFYLADRRHIVVEGVLREGGFLTLSDSDGDAALFNVSGAIHLFDRCLSISGGRGDPMDLIDIEACSPNNEAQRFDFYF